MLNVYDLRAGAPVPGQTSRYATGEAAWALAQLHNLFPDEGWDAPARRVLDYLATARDEVEGLDFPPWADQWAAYTLAELAPWGLDAHHVRYAEALSERFGMLVRYESQKDGWPLPFIDARARGAGLGVWVEGLGALALAADRDDRLADLRPALDARVQCGAGLLAERQPDRRGGRRVGLTDARRRRLVPLRRDTHGRPATRPVGPAGRGRRAGAGGRVRALLALFAAVNPLAVAVALWPRERRATMAVAAAIACAGAIVGAAVSGPILDALDVTPGTFRVAAGLVLGLAGARWLIVGVPIGRSRRSIRGSGAGGRAAAVPGARDAAVGDGEHVDGSRPWRRDRRRRSRRQSRHRVGRGDRHQAPPGRAGPRVFASSRRSP